MLNVRIFSGQSSPFPSYTRRSWVILRILIGKTSSKGESFCRATNANAQSSIAGLQIKSWEGDLYDKLGNEMMIQIAAEVDPIDPEKLRLLGHDTREKHDERMRRLNEDMEATTTRISYGDYPWNPVSPTLGVPACNAIIGNQSCSLT